MNPAFDISGLSPWDEKEEKLRVIIETPKGSRNKFAYDPSLNLIRLKSTLSEGLSFPFDFGFIPQTQGGDGDPLDVLLLMDAPAFPGCLVESHLLGVMGAEQLKKGEKIRNDRLIAVWKKSTVYSEIRDIADINDKLLDQVKEFFISYKRAKGKEFKILGIKDAATARKLIEKGMKKFQGF